MDVSIVLTMLAVGLILGFVGAGGSGFIISILTLLYGVSVHVALATALTAMIFSFDLAQSVITAKVTYL